MPLSGPIHCYLNIKTREIFNIYYSRYKILFFLVWNSDFIFEHKILFKEYLILNSYKIMGLKKGKTVMKNMVNIDDVS
jgi:Pyruvate/2-oxoacid:ferredoxin oxidoreductase gamma subunit